MKPIGEAQLKKQISSGDFMNTYVVFGDETYLKQHYVNSIIKKSVGDNSEFNLSRFNGNADMQQVLDAVSQLPFMSEKRCVVLCDFDIESAKADIVEQLYSIIDEEIQSTVFIIWFDSVQINVKKAKRLPKLVERCEKKGGIGAQIDKKSDAELIKILASAAGKRGCRLETTAGRYMLEVCGRDLQTLQNEIEKLCAYAPGSSISCADIDKVAIRTVDASVFDLTKAINAGNGDRAVQIIADLFFQKVEPIVILSVLSGVYVDMYRAKAAELDGVKPRDIANEFGYYGRSFVLDNAATAARKLNMKQMGQCLQILMETDRALKSSRALNKNAYARTLLEQTVVRLMMCSAGR